MTATNEWKSVPSVLQDIMKRKIEEVAKLKATLSENKELSATLAKRGTFEREYKFKNAIHTPHRTLAVIAEIKRKSPSKGHLATLRDPTHIARVYRDAGANAISVLTDFEGFGGTLDDLRRVAKAQERFRTDYPGPCPVLRKDFVLDEIQLAEAKAAGADAVLLIVSALGQERTGQLLKAAHEFGLDVLVETHDEEELDMALEVGAEIVGVNNRNLNNFEEKLETSFKLADKIPKHIVSVAESGITHHKDAWRFRDAGYNAVLVGEMLVRAYENSGDSSTGYSGGYNQAGGLIKAFRAKGSVEFGTNNGAEFFGRGEGAKESLGELMM